jgi:GrpB-like predicted nucleotidyltransferase (UPF0157 family)
MSRIITICNYQDNWPRLYAAESSTIRPVFGRELQAMEHIGSTSVPGLRAKPTIDIMVVVDPASDITSFYGGMETAGYVCRGECLDARIPGTPGRHFFSKHKDDQHFAHVHVCRTGHFQIREFLALRDFLRAHPDVAKAYGDLKVRLAKRFSLENFQYMVGKDQFVKDLIAQSLSWRSC